MEEIQFIIEDILIWASFYVDELSIPKPRFYKKLEGNYSPLI